MRNEMRPLYNSTAFFFVPLVAEQNVTEESRRNFNCTLTFSATFPFVAPVIFQSCLNNNGAEMKNEQQGSRKTFIFRASTKSFHDIL